MLGYIGQCERNCKSLNSRSSRRNIFFLAETINWNIRAIYYAWLELVDHSTDAVLKLELVVSQIRLRSSSDRFSTFKRFVPYFAHKAVPSINHWGKTIWNSSGHGKEEGGSSCTAKRDSQKLFSFASIRNEWLYIVNADLFINKFRCILLHELEDRLNASLC